MKSDAEELFAWQIRASKLARAQREYRFHPERRWRFDFAWPDDRVAVEIEGGVWTGGRHITGAGFTRDVEKYNAAAELGWSVFRYTSDDVTNGIALAQIERVLRKVA